MRSRILKKCLALVCAVLMAFSLLPAMAAFTPALAASGSGASAAVPDGRVYITSKNYTLVPGAVETVLTTNNSEGTDQRIGYLTEIQKDAYTNGTVKIVAAYKDYQYETLGLQTVMDQAAAYEKAHPGETVIAGINGDFYNMTNGAPSGAFVMEGTVYNKVNNLPYFAILKDGTAVIRDGSHTDLSDVQEAVAGNEIIVTDGKVTVGTSDYEIVSYSRTAIGIKDDGTVITYVTRGISRPTSCGETYEDVAKILAAQGCKYALMLDGGGSSTYASLREGTEKLTVQNSPSDGTPRTVSNTLLVVSTAKSDGVFDHASITPNNEYYTPSVSSGVFGLKKNLTTVQFEAVGIDASGSACDLPESGLTWRLAEESSSMGEIDARTGLFTAAVGQTGSVQVQLMLDGEAVGSTRIQLIEPDELYFSGAALSLDFNEVNDLGLTVKGDGVDLNIKDGDFDWTISPENIGTVSNNIFTSAQKQNETLEGTVSVSYTRTDGTVLKAGIDVEIGKLPMVMMDFENVDTNVRGKDVVGLWDWGAPGSCFSDTDETQYYKFQNYDTLYCLLSKTYPDDEDWIDEVYETEQPWIENEDGFVTVSWNGKEYKGEKTEQYGQNEETWVTFSDENGAEYYWIGYKEQSNFVAWFNGTKSASSILAADGYQFWVWHPAANPSVSTGPLQGEGSQIVDSSEGEVRFGKYALKLTYDFTNFSPTGSTKNCNTYYRVANALKADGSPTGLGMWVYAPEGTANFWFWTQVTYWDGSKWKDAFIHFRPSGAEQTCQYTGINWVGWTYVEADLSSIYAAGAQVDEEHPVQVRAGNPLILLTYIPGGTSDGNGHAIVCGSKSSGCFYIDNVRFVYGTNVDDMDSPLILEARANGTELTTDTAVTLNTNNITFAVDYTDPQGENYSGIDATATQLFLDGSVLGSDQYAATADRVQTVEMELANGEHTLQVSICDNFGNKTNQTYNFVVNNPDTILPTVTIDREEKAELGADYVVKISADHLEKIASFNTTITYENVDKLETVKKQLSNSNFYDDYGNLLTQGSDGNYYDADGNLVEEPMRPSAPGDYSISSAAEQLGENFTGTVRNKLANATTRSFTAEAVKKDTPTNDTTLAVFTLPVPKSLAELDTVPYTVTVSYTTTEGKTYTVTSGRKNIPLWAYYTIEPGVQVSGAANSTLTLSAADGKEIDSTNLKVYSDASTEIENGVFGGNVFTTDFFTSQEAGTTFNKVWVGDNVNKHYSFYTNISVARGAVSDQSAYDLTLNATTGDSASQQHITWFSTTESKGSAVVQYMTKAAYDSLLALQGEEPDINAIFKDAPAASGTAVLTQFGADNVAAYINNVEIEGLSAGTNYVYRAGDGETWSEVSEFKTADPDGTTSFAVVGDTQLTGNETADQEAIDILRTIGADVSDSDFGIQTGDFVDGGIEYHLWDQILGVWGEAFPTLDFAHVMGNHEIYGTAGSTISPALFGLESSEKDYYSVEYGDVYVAVINQTANNNLQEAAEWLIEDAAKSDCTWKIMACHQPLYYTNPNGSSQGRSTILGPACDEAGIDFVFSGHDHSYARTEQMCNGNALELEMNDSNAYVDENGDIAATKGQGTVYYICGDLGEKSRESGYGIVDNKDFHFARASQSYDALYLTVEADAYKMTVNAWNVTENGTELFDTYTMYTGEGACEEAGQHLIRQDEARYDAEAGMLICERCGEQVNPKDINYTGYAVDVNGEDTYGDSQYYFLTGQVKTGFFAMEENFIYANEAGLIDHATENYTTNTCTENGYRMAYSPRYGETYKGGIARYTGHDYAEQEDGSRICSICSHKAIDLADWDYSLAFKATTYTGKAKVPSITIKNPETGETLEFHTDGTGIMTDYTRIWSNNRNVGTATVVINANSNGDYFNSNGPVTLNLEIRPDAPTGLAADAGDTTAELSWNASLAAKTADITYIVYYSANGTTWKKAGTTTDTSYQVSGLNQDTQYYFKVRAQALVDGRTYNAISYSDTVSVVTDEGLSLANCSVSLSWTKTTYNGNAAGKRPTPTVTNPDGEKLVKGTDYTVSYEDNINAGTAKVIVTGKGRYGGTIEAAFTIAPQNLSSAALSVQDAVYTGDNTQTTVQVTDVNGLALTEGKDFTVSYSEHESVGVANVQITGIGNYTGTISGTYQILPRDISELEISAENGIYTGEALAPKVTIEGLIENTDYTVSYEDNINVGTGKAIITGMDNYTGTVEVPFEISPKSLEEAVITDGREYVYTGSAIEADIEVVSDGVILVPGTDYEITGYDNNVNTGTATVTVQGVGNYTGTAEHEFEIVSADVAAFAVTLDPESYVFSGGYKTPKVEVEDTYGNILRKDVDYEVSYSDNKNAGVAAVRVTGIGNYSGTVVKNFTIEPTDIAACTATLEYSSITYSGSEKTPSVVVKTARGTTLKKGTNYTVAYRDNKNAGTAVVEITGIGNYGGTLTQTFEIKKADLSKCTVSLTGDTYYQTGEAITPGVSVTTAKGTKLRNGTNYTVTYSNNVNAGTAAVLIEGTGNYEGSLKSSFTIKNVTDLSGFTSTLSYSYMAYTGTARVPAVKVVTPKGTTLKKGTNYEVTYSDNVEVGTATVTINGIGKYCGTITRTFTIRPPKADSVSVTNVTKNSLKVKIDRNDVADKYYIYANGTYAGCAKTVSAVTVKNLKPNTAYTITVKAVKVVNGKNYYSAADSVKVTTAK